MKYVHFLVLLSCAMWEATGYPYAYYPGYGNMDTLSYGSNDKSRGGMVVSRYYNPYYNPRTASGGMAAFMYRPEEQAAYPQSGQYYYPDRRRQTTLDTYVPPQQNEVIPQQNQGFSPQQNEYYPQQPEIIPLGPTEATEIAEPTERTEVGSTTLKAAVPELSEVEPEVEEVEEASPKPKKAVVSRKKQVKKPVIDEEDDEDDRYAPKMPASAFFPMFFYGGKSSGPGGPTAIANAYSTGRGGVATSHATAYGSPRQEQERYRSH